MLFTCYKVIFYYTIFKTILIVVFISYYYLTIIKLPWLLQVNCSMRKSVRWKAYMIMLAVMYSLFRIQINFLLCSMLLHHWCILHFTWWISLKCWSVIMRKQNCIWKRYLIQFPHRRNWYQHWRIMIFTVCVYQMV